MELNTRIKFKSPLPANLIVKPWLTPPIKHDITRGFVTRVPTEDASRCVDSMETQFGAPPLMDINYRSKMFRLPDATHGRYGTGDHNQGIGILSDTLIDGQRYARAVLSFNSRESTGLMIAARRLDHGVEGLNSDPQRVDYLDQKQLLDI